MTLDWFPCRRPYRLVHWKIFIPMSLDKKWRILHPSRNKWQMTWIAHDHHCPKVQHHISMRAESILIGFTWTSWRFLRAYPGLLVNATMIALIACWRLEQNSNEGARPTTRYHGWKDRLSLTTVGSSTLYWILLKLGALQKLTWLATPIIP